MIQRIQTLYLIIISILASLTAILPIAELASKANQLYMQNTLGVFKTLGKGELVFKNTPLQLILLILVIMCVVTIFRYKNRKLQIRLVVINFLLIAAFYATLFVYESTIKTTLDVTASYKFVLILPLVGFVFNWLAILAIRADEALVKSLDRLR
ncbi:MAG: DUF4293 domain-containing protein [Bacteroidales bacterium]